MACKLGFMLSEEEKIIDSQCDGLSINLDIRKKQSPNLNLFMGKNYDPD